MKDPRPQDLDAVLVQFDRAEANLTKLETLWRQIAGNPPLTIPEQDDAIRAFAAILRELPAIEGFRVEAVPMSEHDRAVQRLAVERLAVYDLEEALASFYAEQDVEEPGRQLAEYRFRFNRARRTIVRHRVAEVASSIDQLLFSMNRTQQAAGSPTMEEWTVLRSAVAELERLVGDMAPGHARWGDLRRHMHFAQDVDLHDIIDTDWPSVKAELEHSLYDDREPIPVGVDDLGELVRARPTGPVSSRLNWHVLDGAGFERLLFELVRTTDGYENASWPTRTNAPDRGRDIQVDRVTSDLLSGTTRQRVIIQCKHWGSKSIALNDIVACREAVKAWQPPPVDILIIATSGRLTQDALSWVEQQRQEAVRTRVEVWHENHLETLLARRPDLIAGFRLR